MGRNKLVRENRMVRFMLLPDLFDKLEQHSLNVNLGVQPGNWQQLLWTRMAREFTSTSNFDLPGVGVIRTTQENYQRLMEKLHGKD